MNNSNIKHDIIERLFSRGIYTRQVNDIQFVTRCPYCGDSMSNHNTGHLYLRINTRDNFPIVYNCFKCPAQGILTYDTLERLGIEDINLKQNIYSMNKSSDKFDKKTFQNEINTKQYNYIIPDIKFGVKTDYINKRLGLNLSDEDLIMMKTITSFRDFLKINKIKTITCKPNFARMLDSDYVGFLTSNRSHILFRDITNKHDISWFKYKIHNDETNSIFFYAISTDIDIFTTDTITINLAEGVFDIASVAFNLNNLKNNTINIGMSGKYYSNVLQYLISMGFAGSNIIINIWSDADHRYKENVYDTTLEFYKSILHKFKYIFGEINIYYNLLGKDFGVPLKDIKIERYRL